MKLDADVIISHIAGDDNGLADVCSRRNDPTKAISWPPQGLEQATEVKFSLQDLVESSESYLKAWQ